VKNLDDGLLEGGLEAGANRVERPGDPPPASA
jgi:hypothetical protein